MRDLPLKAIPTGFNLVFRHEADLSLLRPPSLSLAGIGILTDSPSPMPIGFSLGTD